MNQLDITAAVQRRAVTMAEEFAPMLAQLLAGEIPMEGVEMSLLLHLRDGRELRLKIGAAILPAVEG